MLVVVTFKLYDSDDNGVLDNKVRFTGLVSMSSLLTHVTPSDCDHVLSVNLP